MEEKSAVVLLSGGLDSATILAVARSEGHVCHCLSFDYGQKNRHELAAARRIAHGVAASHSIVRIAPETFGQSAMTASAVPVPKNPASKNPAAKNAGPPEIPSTYVPARNTIFLSYALALSEATGSESIFIGVNSVDYSGYPDCRPEFIRAFQAMANLATKRGVEGRPAQIRAPLQSLGKSGIITWGTSLGVDYSKTLTCYDPVEDGLACGECDSCRLRRKGFTEAGIPDPTRYVGIGGHDV